MKIRCIGKMWGSRPRGQVIVLLCMSIVVIIAFTALAVDFGMMFLSKAKLSRAVDSLGLRLAGNVTANNMSNARVALETIKANYNGFLSNVAWDGNNNTTVPASAISVTTNGSATIISITNGTDALYVTNSVSFFPSNNPIGKVVSVSAKATTKHYNYFLPVMGTNFDYINLSESASARRIPTIVCLILDTSGSMRGNSGYSYMPTAVVNFVNNFQNTQSQDFMAVVTFSTYASLRWPTNFHTNPAGYPTNMIPMNNFVNDIKGFMTNTVENGGIAFASGTCGQEGIRLGYKVVNNLLGTIPADQRSMLRVFYIIFTDGTFNTVRGYFMGNGYNTVHDTNTAPWFHKQMPLACNNNDFSSYTAVKVAGSTASNFTTTTFNLNATNRFGNYDGSGNNNTWTLRPGVSGTIYDPAQYKSLPASTNVVNSSGNSTWKGTNTTSGHRYWTNYFLYRRTNDVGVAKVLTLWDPNAAYAYTDTTVTNSSAYTNVYSNTWRVSYFNSSQQNGYANSGSRYPGLWIPDMPVFNVSGNVANGPYNPIYRTDYPSTNSTNATNTYPTNSAFGTNNLALSSRMMANYPGGGYYANTYNTYYQYDNANAANRHPINTSDNNPYWDNNTLRMNDFYPDFDYGDNPVAMATNATLVSSYTTASSISNYAVTNGYPTNFYSYSNGSSTTLSPGANNTAVANEGYWLSLMQAWIMRKEQNAKIYFVNFNDNNKLTEKRQIANDRTGNNGTGVVPFFPDQQAGAFYFTTDQDTLSAAFKDIAQKINTQLTK